MKYKHIILGCLVTGIACCCIPFMTGERQNVPDSVNSENHRTNDIFNRINNQNYSCESENVKNIVINIFKENNNYYKDINLNTISDIKLIYPATQSFDSSIGKYNCTGNIVMKSDGVAFAPTEQNNNNEYYHIVKSYNKYLIGYDTYEINIRYSAQMSEGNLLVQIPNYDVKYDGKFSCQKTSCVGIIDVKEEIREQERALAIQKERIQDKKDKEPMILPTFKEVQ